MKRATVEEKTTQLTESQLEQLQKLPAKAELDEMAEELRKQAAIALLRFIEDDPLHAATFNTMVLSRQLHWLSLETLQGLLVEQKFASPELQKAVELSLVYAAAARGMAPFEPQEVIDGIQDTTLRWLVAVKASDHQREKEAEAAEQQEQEQERRKRPVPLPFAYRPAKKQPPVDSLTRTRSVVFAGHPGAVDYVLSESRKHLLSQRGEDRCSILYLALHNKQCNLVGNKKQKGRFEIQLGFTQWSTKLAAISHTEKALDRFITPLAQHAADLLVVSDLRYGMSPPFVGFSEIKQAERSHKTCRTWANGKGAGILAGIPLAESFEPPQLDKNWEMLEVHSALQLLSVLPGPYDEELETETYEVCFNGEPVLQVPRERIDNYKEYLHVSDAES